jgi:hypothetical protein
VCFQAYRWIRKIPPGRFARSYLNQSSTEGFWSFRGKTRPHQREWWSLPCTATQLQDRDESQKDIQRTAPLWVIGDPSTLTACHHLEGQGPREEILILTTTLMEVSASPCILEQAWNATALSEDPEVGILLITLRG